MLFFIPIYFSLLFFFLFVILIFFPFYHMRDIFKIKNQIREFFWNFSIFFNLSNFFLQLFKVFLHNQQNSKLMVFFSNLWMLGQAQQAPDWSDAIILGPRSKRFSSFLIFHYSLIFSLIHFSLFCHLLFFLKFLQKLEILFGIPKNDLVYKYYLQF